MKKILLLVLCIALATVFLVGCAEEQAAGDGTWTIGITLQNYENPYWAGVFGHVETILRAEGINFTILDSQDSAATQISQIEGFITAGVDLIMVHPSDPVAIEDVARRAMDEGILFMSWDDIMTNSDLNWVLDNEVLGREIGTAAANFINQHYSDANPAQVAIMNYPMTPILLDRENGIVGALEDIASGRFEIVARQPALDAATAQSNMETILQAHPDVTIVASIGAGGDIGANEAFLLHFGGEIPDNVGIFSADATLQQLNAILNGEATRVTVGFEGSSLRTAQAVVDVYMGLLRGDDMPRNMLRVKTPMDINNAAEYIADYD